MSDFVILCVFIYRGIKKGVQKGENMRRRLLAMLMSVALCATCVMSVDFKSNAEDVGEDISFSELMTEDALVGYAIPITRGVYLADGHSIINKISSIKIGAGGVTNAAIKCRVSINTIVERLDGDDWVRQASWSNTVENGYTAMVSKSLVVPTGHYYRVRCIHYASSDRSSSYTSSLRM